MFESSDGEVLIKKKLIVSVVILVVIILLALMALFTIPAGSVGVITRFDTINRVADQGIHARIPLIEGVHRMDIHIQKALKDTEALSPEYLQYLFLTKWGGVLPQVTGGANAVFDVVNYIGGGE